MKSRPQVRLTATEITSLWQQFIFETLDVCIKKHVFAHIEDADIRSVFQYALSLSESHIEKAKHFFDQEEYPPPIGFTDKDVDLKAPRLFSDAFWLKYMQIMAANGIPNYSLAITTAIRADVRHYFSQCGMEATELYNRSTDVLLSKGLIIRPPHIPSPDAHEVIENRSLLTNLLSRRRPLNGFEISHIFFNLQKTDVMAALLLGFSQVAQSGKVRESMIRVLNTAIKHSDLFHSILKAEYVSTPKSWLSEVTNSSIPPFSDKLLLTHAAVALGNAVFYYGAAISTTMRKDLVGHYETIISKDLLVAADVQNVMMEYGWLEQPPQLTDHAALMKS